LDSINVADNLCLSLGIIGSVFKEENGWLLLGRDNKVKLRENVRYRCKKKSKLLKDNSLKFGLKDAMKKLNIFYFF
jgi:hypothetical protein